MQQSYPTTVLPVTDDAMAQLVSGVILPFTRRDLADASRRTPEAAKKWKEGESAPSLASAINLARQIPAVKALIYSLIETGDTEFESPEVQTKLRATLARVASGIDQAAAIARQALHQLHSAPAGSPSRVAFPPELAGGGLPVSGPFSRSATP